MGGSSEHRATREPKAVVCTLGTLNTDCGKAFSLLRFFVAVGQRNEVPPRTVANSDKKYSKHSTRGKVSSSNPASTPTTDHQPRAQHAASSAHDARSDQSSFHNSPSGYRKNQAGAGSAYSKLALIESCTPSPFGRLLASNSLTHRKVADRGVL